MAKLALNKSALSKEKQKKVSYGRYLPSLEMKQKQLLLERKKAEQALLQHNQDIAALEDAVYQKLPMLAVKNIEMQGLVTVSGYKLIEENLLGTKVPLLESITFNRADYGYLARPHWFDDLVIALEKMMKLKMEEQVLHIRLSRLKTAARTITQRVNLFSKVLIPQAESNIKKIGLFLADQERAGVVRSKLAKKKAAIANG
jgi:V/A-type H+-transporting ATPase subunit D|tara:strand:+ start:1597 stop:2199 length:603 start_codon:yes stop_codon:yes gene_type:complete